MAKPQLTRADCREIRALYNDRPRLSMAQLADKFQVSAPVIHSVLHSQYRPFEDYVEAHMITCTGCGHKLDPALATWGNHSHSCSDRGWHCKACLALCAAGDPLLPGKTYTVVMRDAQTWDQVTGIRELVRDCGHHHRQLASAKACGRKLLHPRCEHGRASFTTRCKLCLGPARMQRWAKDWFHFEIEDSKGHKLTKEVIHAAQQARRGVDPTVPAAAGSGPDDAGKPDTATGPAANYRD